MTEHQRIIQELLQELYKLKKTAYYYGSCGIKEFDKMDADIHKVIEKYDGYKIGGKW